MHSNQFTDVWLSGVGHLPVEKCCVASHNGSKMLLTVVEVEAIWHPWSELNVALGCLEEVADGSMRGEQPFTILLSWTADEEQLRPPDLSHHAAGPSVFGAPLCHQAVERD
ncbi:unnamed protein product [Lota lota]